MLIITRKPGEKIIVCRDNLKLTITMLSLHKAHGNRLAYARLRCDGDCQDAEVSLSVTSEWECWPDVLVAVKELGRGQVTIGVEAPPEVSIDREEVYLKKMEADRNV